MGSVGLSDRLRQAMTSKGISGQRLEREAGVSRGYVSRLLRGHRGASITADQLGALARALDVSPEWLQRGGAEGVGAMTTIHLEPSADDPCPARTAAAELALEGGAPPWAVARVLGLPPDPVRSVYSWLREIVHAQESARKSA
jgi:transcriptional regulator with XRE-family HTH domain